MIMVSQFAQIDKYWAGLDCPLALVPQQWIWYNQRRFYVFSRLAEQNTEKGWMMNFADILLVSDYDNTLTGQMHLVPEENIRAIREFTEQGGAFTIASGRGKREWRESFSHIPFNAPLILGNGAVIYDAKADKTLFQAVFSEARKALVKELISKIPDDSCVLIEAGEKLVIPEENHRRTGFTGFPGTQAVFVPLDRIEGEWDKVTFMSKLPPFDASRPAPVDFSSFDTAPMDRVESLAEQAGIQGIRSLPFLYEIPPEGTDKGTSARRLQDMLKKKLLIAVGDAPNDLALLRTADICFVPERSILASEGTAPENAVITVPCEEASIADLIRILGGFV